MAVSSTTADYLFFLFFKVPPGLFISFPVFGAIDK